MKAKNIFWGLFFLISGGLVIANSLGYLDNLNLDLLLIVYTIILVAIIIKSAVHLNWFGITFSLAFLYIIFAKALAWPFIGYGSVFITALFATIGLSLLFHPKWKWLSKVKNGNFDEVIVEDSSDEEVNVSSNFGSTVSYINSKDLKRVNLKASFSEVKLFFDQAELHKGKAVLNVSVHLSGVEIYVPKTWQVRINTNNNMSGVDEKNHYSDKKTSELIITGNVKLSGVEIRYI